MTASDNTNPLEERHYTITELAQMWKFSTEFVRQIVRGEPGVTEWVRQQPGRRRYSVIRVPQSVAERCIVGRWRVRIKKVQRSPGPTDVVFELLLARLHPRSVVTFGDLDRRMTEQDGNVRELHAAEQQGYGKRVPKVVWVATS